MYLNFSDLRDDLKDKENKLDSQISDIKDDLQSKQDRLDKQVERKIIELNLLLDKTAKNIDRDLAMARAQSMNEITNVKMLSEQLAPQEAHSKINEIFSTKNIEKEIKNLAEERIIPEVNKVVKSTISDYNESKINKLLEDMKSEDYVTQSLAASLLLINDTPLSDKQIKKFIEYLQYTDPAYIQSYHVILLRNKSQLIYDYFKLKFDEKGLDQNPYIKKYMDQYNIEKI